MGFFFDDVEVSAVKKQKELPLNTLQTLGCKACPKFRKNPTNKILDPSGSKAPIIYFLGSHPFQEDFEFNEPFSSSFSDILFNNVPKALTEHLRYNNISNCLETQNEQDNNLSVICCNSRVKKDILDSDPVIIVALGSKVLNWLLPDAPSEFLTAGKEEIYKWRNRYFAVKIDNKVYWVYSLFDFEDLFLKARYNKKGDRLQSEHDITFEKDLQNLFTLLSNGTFDNPPVLIDSNYLENVQWTEGNKSDKELDKVFAWLLNLSSKENIAIDFETNCIKPQKENALLLTIAVGTFDESYAFPYEYPGAWTFTQLSKLKEFLIEFLQINQEKIAHNSKFEQNWILEKFNISYIKNKALFHDTQGQMYTLDERQGMHSLDIGIRLNFGFWLKALSNLDRSRMMDYPLDKILPYNGLDTKWTHKLWQIQNEKLKKDPILYNLYSKRLNKYVCLLTQVEHTGFFIHKPTLERFRKAFTNDVLEAEQELLNLDVCQEYKRKFNKPLNPGSPPQLNTVLINLLDLKNDLVDKHGKVSTGEPLLFKIKDKVPFVDKLLKWRALNKKLTTYITPMFTHLMPDGAVHSNFNAYSTRTSRLSSDNPNLQNIPSRKGKEIREMFVPPKGYLIASADYGQIEARFLGVASQDKAFCEAIWNDYDVHMDWAKKIANAYPLIVNDELDNIKVLSTFRKAVKNQWTFPAFYGASYFSIARAMNIPLKIVEPLFEEFWEEFKGIKLWQQWVLNFYKEHNYVESMFGRRRHGPLSYNEIINTPIQSCLKAGSKIFTDKGIFNIEDLVNKSINVWTGFSYAKATGLCMGEHQLAKITLSSGIEINCDINHKLKNEKREWVNFQDLKIGQYVALTDTFSFDSLPEKQIDWFYFLGFYIGDGCFYKKDSNYPTLELVVGNSKYNDLEKLKDFLNDNLPEKTPKVFIYTDKTKKLHSLCIRGHDFAIFAKNILGLKYEINAHTKTIPEIVWKATKQQQFNFLQGLYDTDGARGKWQEWNLHLCNKTLLQQIQILQTALGIDSTLKQTNYGWLLVQRLGKNYTSRSYPFSTLEQDILDKKIKIKSSEKNESYELKKERIAERRAFLAKNITHSLARRIKNRYQLNEEFYRYDTITNIEILTNKELTYTLSVEDSLHQFVADGVITKNSASDTCLEAASEIAKKYYPDIMPAALIHDDITSYIREDIAEDLLDIIAKEMCTIPQMQEWINVPISAEIKVGYDWFNQVEFKTSKTTDFINLERRKQTFDTYQNYL